MGSSSNHAANEANRMEGERQARIHGTQGAIARAFENPQRAADIADFVNASRAYYTRDLNQQKATADRNLKFALAKSGLIGGSTQVDQQRVLGQEYSRGLLDAEQRAQGAGAQLQAADQDAESRLMSLATSGLDSTTAAQQAAAAMRSSIEGAKSQAALGAASDAFGQISDFVQRSREAQQRRQGYFSTFGGARPALYSSGSGAGYGGL